MLALLGAHHILHVSRMRVNTTSVRVRSEVDKLESIQELGVLRFSPVLFHQFPIISLHTDSPLVRRTSGEDWKTLCKQSCFGYRRLTGQKTTSTLCLSSQGRKGEVWRPSSRKDAPWAIGSNKKLTLRRLMSYIYIYIYICSTHS